MIVNLPSQQTREREKSKEKKNRDKYLDFARELKKQLWNMKVTVIPIVVSALRTIPRPRTVKGTGKT